MSFSHFCVRLLSGMFCKKILTELYYLLTLCTTDHEHYEYNKGFALMCRYSKILAFWLCKSRHFVHSVTSPKQRIYNQECWICEATIAML